MSTISTYPTDLRLFPLDPVPETDGRRIPQPLLRPGRTVHLLDLENLSGGPSDDYRPAAEAWHQAVGINPGDLAVVGVDASGAFTAQDAFAEAGLVVGSGKGGAVRAIARRGERMLSTGRFDTLIIGSGNGRFAELAGVARDHGIFVAVVVLGPGSSVSRRLQATANRVIVLDPGAS